MQIYIWALEQNPKVHRLERKNEHQVSLNMRNFNIGQ